MRPKFCDLFVIGGGIHGAAVARDAAGRGLRVMLAEKGDFASATSSASTKLIHGGLRYLEQFAFSLVRESLREREILMVAAPYLVQPARFLLPIYQDQKRPTWWLWAGLKLYDLLAGSRQLEKSGRLDDATMARLLPLRQDGLKAVFTYTDCRTDDARLTLMVLLDARERGAHIANRCEVTRLAPTEDGFWVTYRDESGNTGQVLARFVINAAGPWVNTLLERADLSLPRRGVRLVRGSHIVLPMPTPPIEDCFTLPLPDGRVIFVLPWLSGRFLLVGTTDAPQETDPATAHCSDAERDYLLTAFNRFFPLPHGPLGAADVVWAFAGVRALVDDGAKNPSRITREAALCVHRQGHGGLISLYGGKLTTHRRLAEEVMVELGRLGAPSGPNWTAHAALPGGEWDRERLAKETNRPRDPISPEIHARWVATYGDRVRGLYERLDTTPALARLVAPGVPEVELVHATEVEAALCAEDFLFRRTKLHLTLPAEAQRAIEEWFGS